MKIEKIIIIIIIIMVMNNYCVASLDDIQSLIIKISFFAFIFIT